MRLRNRNARSCNWDRCPLRAISSFSNARSYSPSPGLEGERRDARQFSPIEDQQVPHKVRDAETIVSQPLEPQGKKLEVRFRHERGRRLKPGHATSPRVRLVLPGQRPERQGQDYVPHRIGLG